jgi:hypothetical protein
MASRRYREPYCNFSLACNLAALNGRDRGNGNDTRGQQGIFHERVKQSGLSSFEMIYACNVETPLPAGARRDSWLLLRLVPN